jgi:hypothetical protein
MENLKQGEYRSFTEGEGSMQNPPEEKQTVTILRRIAKIWRFVNVVLIVLFLITEVVFPHVDEQVEVPLVDYVMLFLFPFVCTLGLILTWRWEIAGGIIAIGSFILFMVIMTIDRGSFFPSLAIMGTLVTAPGILFLVCWYLSRDSKQAVGPG